jgi:hypothetical protein
VSTSRATINRSRMEPRLRTSSSFEAMFMPAMFR